MEILINNKKYKIKAFVFDKDGTLLDHRPYWVKLLDARMGALEQLGVVSRVVAEIRSVFGQDVSGRVDPEGPLALASTEEEVIVATVTLYHNGYNWDKGKALVKKAFCDAEESVNIHEISQKIEGTDQVLQTIKSKGYLLAVATTDCSFRAEHMLRAAGLESYFECIIGRDKVANGKPHPEMLNYIADKLDITENSILMVGDAPPDMEMAASAGSLGVGVLTGIGTYETLSKNALLIVNSVRELIEHPIFESIRR
jgi:phosphoglycolate phosphatase